MGLLVVYATLNLMGLKVLVTKGRLHMLGSIVMVLLIR